MSRRESLRKTARRRESVSGRGNATAKILWHPRISPDGNVADSDDAMERVSEYPEPNARIEEVMQTTGPAPDGSPDGTSECRRLNVGLTARHRRATVPTSEPVNDVAQAARARTVRLR
jgi:hypothetical protein